MNNTLLLDELMTSASNSFNEATSYSTKRKHTSTQIAITYRTKVKRHGCISFDAVHKHQCLPILLACIENMLCIQLSVEERRKKNTHHLKSPSRNDDILGMMICNKEEKYLKGEKKSSMMGYESCRIQLEKVFLEA